MLKIQCIVCEHLKKNAKIGFFLIPLLNFRESLSKFSMIWQSTVSMKHVNQKPVNPSREGNRCICNILVQWHLCNSFQ